jgi:thiamine-phosphate diphosphorylase
VSAPLASPQAWAFPRHAKDIEALLQNTLHAAKPAPVLICLTSHEAAGLLGLAAPADRGAVAQLAQTLRLATGKAVAILDTQNAVYADTPHASGWLEFSDAPSASDGLADRSTLFAESATQAMARGFVPMEALVLASMATADALHQDPKSAPRPDFAQRSNNLPGFSLPSPSAVSGFASLSDPDLGLYAVVDSAAWVGRVLAAGARTVQLRIKDAEGPEQREWVRSEVRQSIDAATAVGAQLLIHDHWQLAVEEGAYGVHLGQEDLHLADLAAIAAAGLRLGISTHCYWEVCRAWALRPSYIACGPVHPTKAKAMPWLPQGNDNLAYWCKLLPLPVVAIAGMDVTRTEEAARCGAAGVAVISAITAAPSPEAAIGQLQQALKRGRQGPGRAAPLLAKPTLVNA